MNDELEKLLRETGRAFRAESKGLDAGEEKRNQAFRAAMAAFNEEDSRAGAGRGIFSSSRLPLLVGFSAALVLLVSLALTKDSSRGGIKSGYVEPIAVTSADTEVESAYAVMAYAEFTEDLSEYLLDPSAEELNGSSGEETDEVDELDYEPLTFGSTDLEEMEIDEDEQDLA